VNGRSQASVDAAVARLGAGAIGFAGDLATAQAAEAVVHSHPDIDILVNNVGGSHPGTPVTMPEEVWDRQIDFNLKTPFLACKYVL
ncbi:SDR family oxidoreductase, partial [Acinetobacter baumannii]